MEIQALGLIEVNGFLGAIAASDAALKTADVKLINAEKIRGGLTTIHLSGDVAAVKVAVDAGSAAAHELGCLLSSHVIPRLSSEASQMVIDSIRQAKVVSDNSNEKKEEDNIPKTDKPNKVEESKEKTTVEKEATEKKAPNKKTDGTKKKK